MKRIVLISVFLLLVSCTSTPVPAPQINPTVLPTATLISYKPTFTIPTPSPTLTPVVCDPFTVDFCVTDGHFVFQRPIKSPANTFIDTTYPYASTANGYRDPHHGVEFLNKFGTPVYAAGDGVILFAGQDKEAIYSLWPDFYGNVIVIRHADDLYTLYAHLSKIIVEEGQSVSMGEKIGEVGQSGVAVGPHLHFEVRHGDVKNYFSTMNPELWLVPNKNANGRLGIVQIAILTGDKQLVKNVQFTMEFLSTKKPDKKKTFFGVTYSSDMLTGEENAGLGDLSPGEYRIAFKYDGQLYERYIEVESGKLTQVVFVVK